MHACKYFRKFVRGLQDHLSSQSLGRVLWTTGLVKSRRSEGEFAMYPYGARFTGLAPPSVATHACDDSRI